MPSGAAGRLFVHSRGPPPPWPAMSFVRQGAPYRLSCQNPGHETRHAEIHVEAGPVEPISRWRNLDLGKLLWRSFGQAFDKPRREGEGAAVAKFHDDAHGLPVVAGRRGMRFSLHRGLATRLGGVEFCLGQVSHGSASTGSETRPDHCAGSLSTSARLRALREFNPEIGRRQEKIKRSRSNSRAR